MAKIIGFHNLDKKVSNAEWRATNAAFRLALRGFINDILEKDGGDRVKLDATYDTKRQASKFRRSTGAVYKHWASKNVSGD